MEIIVSSIEQFNEYLKSDRVVVDFNAKWCGPCRMLSPVLEEIAEEDKDLVVLKVDTDVFPQLASLYKVSAIPALFFIKKGEVVGNELGFMPKPRLVKIIEDKLGK